MFNWLKTLASNNQTASTKRVAYLLVTLFAIFWLTYNIFNAGISDLWVTAFQTLIASVSLGYVGGFAIERNKNKTENGEQ